MKKYNFTAEPYGRAFMENEGKTIEERTALGMLETAKYANIVFPDNCMLPTVQAPKDSVFVFRFSGLQYDDERVESLMAENPEHADEIKEICDHMLTYVSNKRRYKARSEDYYLLDGAHALWGGGWGGHGNPDYTRYLHLGTNGIRELIEKYRAMNPGRDRFYNALSIAMDALDVVGSRVREEALNKAKETTDESKKAEFERIAETFKRIPMEPAWDMYSAVMMFWMDFTFDGVDSPGRLDQSMIKFWRASDPVEASSMVTRLLEAIHNVRAWNLCISGSDENWNDETNELSYEFLKQVTELQYQTPNLTMRVGRNTPDKLWRMAAECIGTGIGLPAIYNDEVVCPALEAIGITPEDAHDYCMNGCNQIDIYGKSHMGLEDGEINMAKALEYTLHNGVDYGKYKGMEQVVPDFGNPADCKTFEEFVNLYYQHLDYLTDVACDNSNRSQRSDGIFCVNPLRSCLIEGCIEKGIDYKNGGPKYGHGQILAEGIADAADSLWAVYDMIYNKKKYTMDELVEALKNDFVGAEELRLDFASCDKFGNDIEGVDKLCGEITDHLFKYLKTKKTYRGGMFTGGCSPFSRAARNGMDVAALPNGRHSNESNFADSIAATPGNDVNGPTASINSMLNYAQCESCSGFVTQMKFNKTTFNTEKGLESFITLMKSYFARGGQQVSINVVDRATLLAAQKNPEKYKNLIVRVGGYSEYFNRLSPELQQNVIDRTGFTW